MITLDTTVDEAEAISRPYGVSTTEYAGRQCQMFDSYMWEVRNLNLSTIREVGIAMRMKPNRIILMGYAMMMAYMPVVRELHDKETQLELLRICALHEDSARITYNIFAHGLPADVVQAFAQQITTGEAAIVAVPSGSEYF